MDPASEIWNRATRSDPADPQLEPGDRALSAMLQAHGMVMSGGVEHLVESFDESRLAAALAGYRFFSLTDVADLLERASRTLIADDISDDQVEALDDEYATLVPTDQTLDMKFRSVFQREPTAFAPI
jgi:hypothetical protein